MVAWIKMQPTWEKVRVCSQRNGARAGSWYREHVSMKVLDATVPILTCCRALIFVLGVLNFLYAIVHADFIFAKGMQLKTKLFWRSLFFSAAHEHVPLSVKRWAVVGGWRLAVGGS